jgi:multiple antibiotic resistance protein
MQFFQNIWQDLNWQEFASCFMVLFAIIGVLSNIPVIIEVQRKFGKNINAKKTAIFATGIMLGFLFFGESVLHLIGIDIRSFAVAGSFILFFIALEMVLDFSISTPASSEKSPQDPSIVPLAFPLVAGAGSMTTIVSLKAQHETVNIALAIVLNMILVYFVLKSTKKIEQFIGAGGSAVMKKLFGLILLAIAIKLFTGNLKVLLN